MPKISGYIDEIRKWYSEEYVSVKEIAKRLKISEGYVRRVLFNYAITRKRKSREFYKRGLENGH